MDTGQAGAEGHGAPLAFADNLELHAAADRLGHAERAAQGVHADGLLRGLPVLEARLEGVRGGRGAGGLEGRRGHAVAEGVVDAGGGGGGAGCRGKGAGLRILGDYAHGLIGGGGGGGQMSVGGGW